MCDATEDRDQRIRDGMSMLVDSMMVARDELRLMQSLTDNHQVIERLEQFALHIDKEFLPGYLLLMWKTHRKASDALRQMSFELSCTEPVQHALDNAASAIDETISNVALHVGSLVL